MEWQAVVFKCDDCEGKGSGYTLKGDYANCPTCKGKKYIKVKMSQESIRELEEI